MKQCSINNFKYNVIVLKEVLETQIFIEDENQMSKRVSRRKKVVENREKLFALIPEEAS